jgi:hypothetical protein
VSPPEPVVSLAPGAVMRRAMRRQASAWAVGNAATKLCTIPGAESAKLLEGDDRADRRGRGRLCTRRGGRPRHARHGDGPVTWEALISPRNKPVVRRPGDHSPTLGASAGCRHQRPRTSTRAEVGQRQGKTGAEADGNQGVGGLHRSCEVGERGRHSGPGGAKAVRVDVNFRREP